MNIRVLRVLTRLGAGGPPRHSLLLTRELRALGYDTRLAIGTCGAADGDMSYLAADDDPIVRVPGLRPEIDFFDDVRATVALVRLMREWRPQIVHTHTAKAGALGRIAARMAQVPVVLHTFHGHVMNGYFSRPMSHAIRAMEKCLARVTDAICVLSPSQAAEISSATGARNLHVVPLGMDLAPFAALPLPPRGPVTIGWFGRFVPVKNIPLLADVIRRVRAQSDLRFVIAGDGPERDAVRALACEGVTCFEWQRDIRPLLSRCHLMLQTSRNEGTPVSLIEGMAAGRPFVATDAGGVSDLADSGRCGVCCAQDAGVLADALLRLATDSGRRAEMGKAAARFAARSFHACRLVETIDGLYRRLLSYQGIEHA